MSDFAGPIGALQTMAENIFFGFSGRFADLNRPVSSLTRKL